MNEGHAIGYLIWVAQTYPLSKQIIVQQWDLSASFITSIFHETTSWEETHFILMAYIYYVQHAEALLGNCFFVMR